VLASTEGKTITHEVIVYDYDEDGNYVGFHKEVVEDPA
jgi:hypothetical protein